MHVSTQKSYSKRKVIRVSITSISNNLTSSYPSQVVQQNQQQSQTSNTDTSIGAAAVLALSNTSSTTATSTTSSSAQSGDSAGSSSGGAAKTSACPLGNKACISCGQCGKTTTAAQSKLQNSASTSDASYQTLTAINSYDANSIFL